MAKPMQVNGYEILFNVNTQEFEVRKPGKDTVLFSNPVGKVCYDWALNPPNTEVENDK